MTTTSPPKPPPIDGIWYYDGTEFVGVEGRIDLRVDIESVGEAFGPYDDGTDYSTKWDYETKGHIKVWIHLIDPDGNPVDRHATLKIEKVTIFSPAVGSFYFFDCRYRGETYSCYVGQGSSDSHIYMPVLGEVLGGWDNYPIVHGSGGDFSYDLNDPAVY